MYQGFSYMVVRGYPRVNKSRGQGRGVRKAIRREGVKCELEGNNFTIIKWLGSKPIYYKILGMILVFLIGNYLLFLTRWQIQWENIYYMDIIVELALNIIL